MEGLADFAAIAAKKPEPLKPIGLAPAPLVRQTNQQVTAFKRDESMYNADGKMKSWADLCDSDEEDEDKEGVILDW